MPWRLPLEWSAGQRPLVAEHGPTLREDIYFRRTAPTSFAREVACAAESAPPETVVPLQRRPTMNREPAQRPAQAAQPARAETPRAPSGTGRRRVRAGL